MGESAPVVVGFLVPLCDDATRVPHGAALWAALETAIVDRFGGFTLTGTVNGAWRDSAGNIVREPSRAYETDVPEARVDDARALLRAACAAFGQQTLRVTVLGRAEYLAPCAAGVAAHGLAL